ncbi:MAG: hypothetical protein HY820_33270 [Acidobacteria bacterium]|nr:hypothetical protein [Acidobacteriota bacterium]
MKLRKVLPVLAVILLAAGYVTGHSSLFTNFTGNDTFVGILDPGKLSCPGGQLDPTWSTGSPCTPGSRVHIRDSRFAYYLHSSVDRITGAMELTSANGNYDGWRPDLQSPGSGQMWGTIRVNVEGFPNEVWEGTWNGTRTVTGNAVVITTHVVLFGAGGRIQGMKAEFRGTADPLVGGTYEGWILAPP